MNPTRYAGQEDGGRRPVSFATRRSNNDDGSLHKSSAEQDKAYARVMSDNRYEAGVPRTFGRGHTGLTGPARVASDYTVGWLCALHTELAASKAMLDVIHDSSHFTVPINDRNTYVLGSIGAHNVVMACLPADAYGTNSAANVASNMLHTFPSLRIRFMVGVGAGVPSRARDIRLGDVAVSTKIWQYDLGKTVQGGRVQRTDVLWKPPADIMTAVQVLKARHEAEINTISETVTAMVESHPAMAKYAHPGRLQDWLFSSEYEHELGDPSCENCDSAKILPRAARRSDAPKIYYGCIASGNQVMKHATTRDAVAREHDVICFEMEAAGLMDSFHCLVIRGICDYADSHKNKKWQEYAAATAAGYAKELLSVVAAKGVRGEAPTRPQHLKVAERRKIVTDSLAFPEMYSRHFTIKEPLATTCEWVLKHPDYTDWTDPTKFAQHHGFWWIKGKPGAGKSTLMKFLLAQVKGASTTSGGITLSFFFNARGSLLEKSVLGMYRTLLFLLLNEVPELQEVFDGPISGVLANKYHTWTVPILQSLLLEIVPRLGSRCLTCLVDALDECEQEQVQDMVNNFEALGNRALQSGTKVYVCFSSRHYPSVHIHHGRELTLENQAGHSQDLETFVRRNLAHMGTRDYVEEIATQILQKANGVFVWVSLVVEIVKKEFQNGRIFAVRRRLQEIPPRLKDLFKHIITQDGDNISDLLLCVQWLLFSERPLEPDEFYFALVSGLDPNLNSIGPGANRYIAWADYDRFVVSSSKGLAQVTAGTPGTVQFIHESVRDFFLKENGLSELWPNLGANFESLSHNRLTWCCWAYMEVNAQTALSLHLDSNPQAMVPNLRRLFPFLGYAAKYMLSHADAAGRQVSQLAFLNHFNVNVWLRLDSVFYIRPSHERETMRRDSLLVRAAERNWAHIIRAELARRPPGDIRGGPDRHALVSAWRSENQEAFNALLQEDPRLWMERSRLTQVELMYTDVYKMPLTSEDLEPLEFMIEEGRSNLAAHVIKVRQVHHNSMVHEALEEERRTLASLLLTKPEVDCSFRGKGGVSPLMLAAWQGFEEIIDHIIRRRCLDGATYHNPPELTEAVFEAIDGGHAHVVRQLLQAGASTDILGFERTPLTLACRDANGEIAALLIEFDADINMSDRCGATPLSEASGNEMENIVKLLLERGCNVNAQDDFGDTALLQAVRAVSEPIVKLLLAADADVNLQNAFGITALLEASKSGEEGMGIIEMLLVEGASVNHQDEVGNTALMHAAASGCQEMVETLIKAGADVNVHDSQGETALFGAADSGDLPTVQTLIDAGANVNARNFQGEDIISYNRVGENLDVVCLLIENDPNLTPEAQLAKIRHYQRLAESDDDESSGST